MVLVPWPLAAKADLRPLTPGETPSLDLFDGLTIRDLVELPKREIFDTDGSFSAMATIFILYLILNNHVFKYIIMDTPLSS